MWPRAVVMKEVLSGREEEDPKRERGGGATLHACSHAPSPVAMRRWLGPPTPPSLLFHSLPIYYSFFLFVYLLGESGVKENGEKALKGKGKG